MNDMNPTKPTGAMSEETRELMDSLSTSLLKLHKLLLDDAKTEYEAAHGPITSVNAYFQLVLDDPHFAWLRKLSSLVALIDEATTLKRLAVEEDAQGLLDEVKVLLSFKDLDEEFNSKFRSAVERNAEAASLHRYAAERVS